jgi:F-type H+-transporting ATPase subunit gamma
MTTAREVNLRMRSVKNISQVTRALQAVSASKARQATQALLQSRPYALKSWQVLTHLARQPGRDSLHPLLTEREEVRNVVVLMTSGDRGLAGAYTTNIIRFTLQKFGKYHLPVRFVPVGRKGRDLLHRIGKPIMAEFTQLPDPARFIDVSAIGRVLVEEFLNGGADEVHLVYTDFVNMLTQIPRSKKILPLEWKREGVRVQEHDPVVSSGPAPAYIYEPGPEALLNEIVPRFTALQVYEAILESQASEHAARMVAMKNATDNATELAEALQLEYNKVRQQAITGEMLDIAGGAEALAQSRG